MLDEFALHPDPRKLWSIAYPGITWGGTREVISTHRGSHNFFNELIREIAVPEIEEQLAATVEAELAKNVSGLLAPVAPRSEAS